MGKAPPPALEVEQDNTSERENGGAGDFFRKEGSLHLTGRGNIRIKEIPALADRVPEDGEAPMAARDLWGTDGKGRSGIGRTARCPWGGARWNFGGLLPALDRPSPRLARGTGRARRTAVAQQLLQLVADFPRIYNRFGNILVTAGRQGCIFVLGQEIGGDCNNGQLAQRSRHGTDPAGDLQTVHHGQLEIQEHDIRPIPRNTVQRFLARGGFADGKLSHPLQPQNQNPATLLVILDHQDFRTLHILLTPKPALRRGAVHDRDEANIVLTKALRRWLSRVCNLSPIIPETPPVVMA
jgi:hypothetical protein